MGIIIVLLFALLVQGCATKAATSTDAAQPELSSDDLNMINEYIKEVGAQEISLESAEDINHSLYENSQTQEIKSEWQFLVDYVRNEKSKKPAALNYSIKFGGSTIEMRLGNIWEHLGG